MPQINEVLSADAMSLALYVGGQSKVGVGISGTWVGTVNFYGSTDGINFIALGMTPFASGTAVSSVTANGNWEAAVQNFLVVKAVFTRTSGSAIVKMAASVDSSYQSAFLASSTIYPTSAASSGANTLTQTAQANRAWRLRFLTITLNAQPSWVTSPHLQIKDGTTVLWSLDLPPSGSSGVIYNVDLPADGIVGTPGNAMSVVLASPGSVKSNINAAFDAA